jgi:hypothetical protein
MNIVIPIDFFNEDHLFFFEKIKNNIISNGFFIKIIFSTSFYSLNVILIDIPLFNIKVIYKNNKSKYYFDILLNEKRIEKIKNIEYNILKKANINEKIPNYKINEILNNGIITIFNSNEIDEKINERHFVSMDLKKSHEARDLFGERSMKKTDAFYAEDLNLTKYEKSRYIFGEGVNKNYYKSINIILKISGIWISDNNFGLSYKFNRLL